MPAAVMLVYISKSELFAPITIEKMKSVLPGVYLTKVADDVLKCLGQTTTVRYVCSDQASAQHSQTDT
jgi:hypothetical protein